jgi:hypothetical protein
VAEVVCRLRGVVEAPLPEIVAVAGEQVGAEAAPLGPPDTTQVKLTVPVNPPDGVSVMVEAADPPGPAIVTGVAAMATDGVTTAPTLTEAVVDAVILPVAASAPFTVRE